MRGHSPRGAGGGVLSRVLSYCHSGGQPPSTAQHYITINFLLKAPLLKFGTTFLSLNLSITEKQPVNCLLNEQNFRDYCKYNY